MAKTDVSKNRRFTSSGPRGPPGRATPWNPPESSRRQAAGRSGHSFSFLRTYGCGNWQLKRHKEQHRQRFFPAVSTEIVDGEKRCHLRATAARTAITSHARSGSLDAR